MTRWIRYACLLCLPSLGPLVLPRKARAQPEAKAAATEPSAIEKARAAYREGAERYRQGRYREALDRFEAAHRLAPSAVLLFNMAQSHRNLGDCPRALQAYRDYLQAEDDDPSASERRSGAGIHVANLDLVCGGAAAAQTAPEIHTMPVQAPGPDPHTSLRRLGWAGLISASVLGGTAAGLYLWNTSRVDRLVREDQRLDQDPRLRPEEVVTASARNEELRRSVDRIDDVTVGVAVLGGVAAVVSAVAFARARVPAEVRVACLPDCQAGLSLRF